MLGVHTLDLDCRKKVNHACSILILVSGSLLVAANALAEATSSSSSSSQQSKESEEAKTLSRVYVTATTENSYSDPATASATKMIMTLRETPQSVSVITQQQMEDWGAVNVKDILTHTTGIYTSTGASQDRPSYNVRGGSANLIQIDGVQQFPGGRRPNVTGDSIAYERVEILRGANGLVAGVGDPTATVNLIRKRATSKTFTGSVGASAGSWDNYRAELDISTPLDSDGNIRTRVAAASYDRDSYIDRYGQEKTSFYGTVEADLSQNTLVRAGVEIADTETRGSINTNAAPYYFSDGSKVNPSRGMTGMTAQWSNWPLDEKTYFAGIDHSFTNGWHLNAITTLNTIEMQGGKFLFVYPTNDYTEPDGSSASGFTYGAVIASSKDEQKTFDITLQGPFELLGRKHELVFSYNNFDRSRTTYGFSANQNAISLAGVNYFTWNGDIPHYPFQDTGRASEAITQSGGAFITARFSLADPLKLILGARTTNWETETDNYNPLTGAYLKTTGAYDVSNEITPYAGLVYDVSDTISLYTSYADAFQPQNLYDANDQLLDPVVGEAYEVGTKGEFLDGSLNASLAYFENEKNNVGIRDPDYPTNYLTPNKNSPYIASGKGNKAKGIELEVSGELQQGWNLYGGISQTTTRNNKGVRINTEIPKTLFNIYSTYHFKGALDKLTVGGGANWQSAYEINSVRPTGAPRTAQGAVPTIAELRRQSDVLLINVMARYQISTAFSLSLNANNLFDKGYFSSISSYDGSVTWGEPRNLRLAARYRF